MRFALKTLLFCAVSGLCACLPQAGTVGESVQPAVGMAASDGKFNDSSEIGTGSVEEGLVSGPAMSPSEPSRAMAYSSVPSPMPAGTVAPTHDPSSDAAEILRGTKTNECSLFNGVTRVHVVGRAIGRYLDGREFPIPGSGQEGLRVYYKTQGSEPFFAHADIIFSFPPPARVSGAVQMQSEPRNYVDFIIETSEPDSIHYYPVFIKDPGSVMGPPPPPKVGSLPVHDELTDESSLPVPPCIKPKMEMMQMMEMTETIRR